MPQQTPNVALTYPEATDHTRLWEHLQTLADDVDRLLPFIQYGTVDITGDGSDTARETLIFPTPFGSTPSVFVTPQNNSLANVTLVNPTPVQTDLSLRRVDGGTVGSTTTVHWVAVGLPA